ncbi:MAG: hypothetical protein K6G52_00985 [Treponemataceae bacterium]|nr:hypothetical protein [Treponemataceae bacterium]
MKKIKIALVALMIAVIACPVFAAKKGPKAKMAVNRPVIIDYQGQSLGKEIPRWVEVLVEGENAKVEKELGLSGVKTFIVEADGPNKEFLQTWTDLVRIETEVAGQIERQVAQSIQATMKGTEADETEVQKAIDMYAASLKNVTINGLEKKASFWIQTQTVKPGLKKAKSADDLIVKYSYYVVYCCDQEMFNKQIQSAMEDIEDNTKYADLLRQKTTEALCSTLTVAPATTLNN